MPRGRPAGAENKTKQGLRARLAERFPEWDPVVQMAGYANDESLDWEQRFQACKEVAPYLVPKMKHIEHTGTGGVLHIVLSKDDAEL